MSMGMNQRAIGRGWLECDEEALKTDGKALEGDVDVLKGEGLPLKSKVKH